MDVMTIMGRGWVLEQCGAADEVRLQGSHSLSLLLCDVGVNCCHACGHTIENVGPHVNVSLLWMDDKDGTHSGTAVEVFTFNARASWARATSAETFACKCKFMTF